MSSTHQDYLLQILILCDSLEDFGLFLIKLNLLLENQFHFCILHAETSKMKYLFYPKTKRTKCLIEDTKCHLDSF